MSIFDFDKIVRNKAIDIRNQEIKTDIEKYLLEYLQYVHKETCKGKIPLIVTGSGISTSNLIINGKNKSANGLPTLFEMIDKIGEYIKEDDKNELAEFTKTFPEFTTPSGIPENIDRDWMSKVFTALESAKSGAVKTIWEKFCNWFLLHCIDNTHGALNTQTSDAAVEIQKFARKSKALCLSANFDNYLDYNFAKPSKIKNKPIRGMSIFKRPDAEKNFKRIQRNTEGNIITANDCVFHSNGDVFWLSCSGDVADSYCPKTGVYTPAFNWFSIDQKDITEDDLVCDICTSKLRATMTMPGTYKKDYDTREMLSAIWKYMATKISTVITIGLSCNWDDVLLKFIISLLDENNIPHLDINNKSADHTTKMQIHERIVNDNYFNSVSLTDDAALAMDYLNQKYDEIKQKSDLSKKTEIKNFEEKNDLIKLFEKLPLINNLEKILQIGLKGHWKNTTNNGLNQKNNRWDHSKDVAENALKYYRAILPENERKASEEVLLYMSGLLHDCGHLPFSHLLEAVFSELSWKFENNDNFFKHEHYTSYLIKKLFEVDSKVDKAALDIKNFADKYCVESEDIIKVIEGNYGIGYIDAMINSEIDSDKIAYLFTDANNTNTNMMISKDEFLKKLTKNAHITQEKLIALDSEAAWIAFRLLDERKRLYEELYFADDLRFRESAVRFILITYFVQQYNKIEDDAYKEFENEQYSDLSHCRIKMAIKDFFSIINGDKPESLSLKDSIGQNIQDALFKCMVICTEQDEKEEGIETTNVPKEIIILKEIYRRLTDKIFDDEYKERIKKEDILKPNLLPINDNAIKELSDKLKYKQLLGIRKRIHLNFPGILLIDVYESVKYLSTAKSRRKHPRIDGTNENQVIYLVPRGERKTWCNNKEALANTDISEYVDEHKLDIQKCYFNVYKLSDNNSSVEHAINMLKKEMKRYTDTENEEDDE
ncbi:MAG: HD domain-containing protein [Treponema sp.]|jgi:HD superfamily phosphohydrolase|nr:HD domain-containing protein [Treponema sp.]